MMNKHVADRHVSLCALILIAVMSAACGELEPIDEPEIVDMQLTLDTLRTQLRDAQRNLAEVRAELESRRQELADAQVARAQLEGRVREAERRVIEARHVIDVQREELLVARAERERVYRSSMQSSSRTKQYHKRAAKPATPPATTEPPAEAVPTGAAFSWSFGTSPSATPAINALAGKRGATAAAMGADPSGFIVVKSGDTLWKLARKYRIGVDRLRSINYLTDDQIEPGQILLLSDFQAAAGSSADMNP